jgi:thioredoxin 1
MFELTIEDEFYALINKNQYIHIDFYATWCNPCKRLAQNIQKFNRDNSNLFVIKVNIDNFNSLCDKYSISNLPTLKLFVDGVEKIELVGYNPNHMNTIKQYIH